MNRIVKGHEVKTIKLKLFILAIALIMAITLVACNRVNIPTNNPSPTNEENEADNTILYGEHLLNLEQVWLGDVFEVPVGTIIEITLNETSNLVFRYERGFVTVEDDNGKRNILGYIDLMGVMPINVFLADLNGDGFPEICITTSAGSGIIDYRVCVYDYVNDIRYDLSDRFEYNYVLSIENEQLIVSQYLGFGDSAPHGISILEIIDGNLVAHGIDRIIPPFEVPDILENPTRPYHVNLHASEITASGLTFFLENTSDHRYMYNSEYSVWRFNSNIWGDGFWENLQPLSESQPIDTPWSNSGMDEGIWRWLYGYDTPLMPGSSTDEETIDWTHLYGELPSGIYRFGKSVQYAGELDLRSISFLEYRFSIP